MSEGSFQSSALKYLNSVEGCTAENVSGNSQQSGRPDINGVYRGQSFRMELKILDNSNKPTKKQLMNLIKWFRSGSAICVAYSIEDVKHFIIEMRHRIPWSHIYKNGCLAFGYYDYAQGDVTADEFFKQYKQLYIQD